MQKSGRGCSSDKAMERGDGEASSTVLRSCHAGQSRVVHLLQTAWCRSRRNSGCTPRWGRNECLRSNSSTSHRDSESGAAVREKKGKIVSINAVIFFRIFVSTPVSSFKTNIVQFVVYK